MLAVFPKHVKHKKHSLRLEFIRTFENYLDLSRLD